MPASHVDCSKMVSSWLVVRVARLFGVCGLLALRIACYKDPLFNASWIVVCLLLSALRSAIQLSDSKLFSLLIISRRFLYNSGLSFSICLTTLLLEVCSRHICFRYEYWSLFLFEVFCSFLSGTWNTLSANFPTRVYEKSDCNHTHEYLSRSMTCSLFTRCSILEARWYNARWTLSSCCG